MKKFCTGVYSYLMSPVMCMSLLLNAAGLAVMFGFMLVEMVDLNKRTAKVTNGKSFFPNVCESLEMLR